MNMKKNVIYMVAIDHPTSQFKVSDYSGPAIKSWEAWCKKYDVDFYLNDKHDESFGRPIWNKEKVFELMHKSQQKVIKKYEQ